MSPSSKVYNSIVSEYVSFSKSIMMYSLKLIYPLKNNQICISFISAILILKRMIIVLKTEKIFNNYFIQLFEVRKIC